MIRTTIRLKAAPKHAAEAETILRGMVERTQHTPGCLGCHVYQDLQDRSVLLFEEEWQTPTDLDRHLRSDTYRCLIEVLEMAIQPPQIRFDTIAHSAGLETIAHAKLSLPEVG